MAKLIKFGLGLARHAELEGARMSGLEGQSNVEQATDRPAGRPFNSGVPKASKTGRKSRKTLSR